MRNFILGALAGMLLISSISYAMHVSIDDIYNAIQKSESNRRNDEGIRSLGELLERSNPRLEKKLFEEDC